jgi:hypothetical protein
MRWTRAYRSDLRLNTFQLGFAIFDTYLLPLQA